MKKQLFLTLNLFLIAIILGSTAGLATAGTTGDITAPSNVKKGLMFYIHCKGLTDNGEYIIVPSSTSMGLSNITFTADGTDYYYQAKLTSTGSLTLTLYGATNGVATITNVSDPTLDSTALYVSSIGIGVVDTSAFTDLLPWLIPIAIVIGLVGIFSIRRKLKAA